MSFVEGAVSWRDVDPGVIRLASRGELAPYGFEQLWNAGTGDSRYPEELDTQLRRPAFHRQGAFFIVQCVDLVRADQLWFHRQLRSEQLQFAPDDIHVAD